uniref:Deoxyribodipyrimidine photo-lyase n=1 Tax=Tetradesmus obliquus TaxID=3088 RepID=A0A383VG34_TETOB|eukprot:jgi/Sobl393_1/19882/SZX64525.1
MSSPAPKRKADGAAAGASRTSKKPAAPAPPAAAPAGQLVNPKRLRMLKEGQQGPGPVIYWMSRDQRMRDNWALLYALERAAETAAPVAVAFNLVPAFLGAGARQFVFMLKGLQELAPRLTAAGIPFFLLQGEPGETLPQLVADTGAGLLVTDYSPLRLGRTWKQQVSAAVAVPVAEVDAHNVVPVWVASDKREYAARTIRPKIQAKLPEFLREYPPQPRPAPWGEALPQPPPIDWEALLAEVRSRGAAVPEVSWAVPGEDAGAAALMGGPASFLSPARLALYATQRNDPGVPQALSNLSPWLHFGQLAPQRAALEAAKLRGKHRESVEGFLEELVIRRELSDNYCHHCPDTYDSLDACYDWARQTLRDHAGDKREFVYTRAQLEAASTHDELWNAAQLEMVHRGKMHGFMRMYWAKKILEWTASPEEALAACIYLNDKYFLDGRDPNGYVGCMWSIGGLHDQGWGERPVFGKIRYMNYAGCKRKFDIAKYVSWVNKEVAAIKREQAAGSSSQAAAAAAGGAAAASPPVAAVFTKAAAAAAAKKAARKK